MYASFGTFARPASTHWEDARRDASLEAMRVHLRRIATYRSASAVNPFGPVR